MATEPQGPNLSCRMYQNEFPEIDEVVMVQVKSIAEMGAYVSLLEYNNMEGMILMSELSRRRIRSISKLIKVGRQEPVMVLRVDEEKGYIDLSKRRVSPEDVEECQQRYAKSKLVHSILTHVATTTNTDLEDLYRRVSRFPTNTKQIGWPLYRMYGHAFDGFKHVVADPENTLRQVEDQTGEGMEEWRKEELMKQIKRRMTPQPLKIRSDVEVTCFAYDGVNHIKDAVREAAKVSSEDCPVKIHLVASPLYVVMTHTLKKDKGLRTVQECIDILRREVEGNKGKVVVKEAPRAVSDRDDRLLQEKLEASESKHGAEEEEEQDETMGSFDVENGPQLTEQR